MAKKPNIPRKLPDATRLDLEISNNLVCINVVVSAVQPTIKE